MHTFILSKDGRTATILFVTHNAMMEIDTIEEEVIISPSPDGTIAYLVPVDVLAPNYVSRLNGGPGFKIDMKDAKRIDPCPECGKFRIHKDGCPEAN